MELRVDTTSIAKAAMKFQFSLIRGDIEHNSLGKQFSCRAIDECYVCGTNKRFMRKQDRKRSSL